MKHRKTAHFSFLICVRHFATPNRRYLLKRQLSPHFNGNSICSISQGWKSNYSQHPSLHDLFLKDISLFWVNEQKSRRISATRASGPSPPIASHSPAAGEPCKESSEGFSEMIDDVAAGCVACRHAIESTGTSLLQMQRSPVWALQLACWCWWEEHSARLPFAVLKV